MVWDEKEGCTCSSSYRISEKKKKKTQTESQCFNSKVPEITLSQLFRFVGEKKRISDSFLHCIINSDSFLGVNFVINSPEAKLSPSRITFSGYKKNEIHPIGFRRPGEVFGPQKTYLKHLPRRCLEGTVSRNECLVSRKYLVHRLSKKYTRGRIWPFLII